MGKKGKIALSAAALAASLSIGVGIGAAIAAQPHMDAALASLKVARTELNAAVPDKGGHRVKAIQLVTDAIQETQAGINFAN